MVSPVPLAGDAGGSAGGGSGVGGAGGSHGSKSQGPQGYVRVLCHLDHIWCHTAVDSEIKDSLPRCSMCSGKQEQCKMKLDKVFLYKIAEQRKEKLL